MRTLLINLRMTITDLPARVHLLRLCIDMLKADGNDGPERDLFVIELKQAVERMQRIQMEKDDQNGSA